MMDFINSISDTIVSLVNFLIDSILGILNLFDILMTLVTSITDSFLGFFPSSVLPFFLVGMFISILLFFLNRGR